MSLSFSISCFFDLLGSPIISKSKFSHLIDFATFDFVTGFLRASTDQRNSDRQLNTSDV